MAPPVAGQPLLDARHGGSMQEYGQEVHPFDQPYAVLKALQAELAELRESAQQETEKREAEDARLHDEVVELWRAVAQERASQTVRVDNFERSLGLELAGLQKALQEARLESSRALQEQRKITVGDLDATRVTIAALSERLDVERTERLVQGKELSDMVGGSLTSQDNLAAKLQKDTEEHLRIFSELQAQGEQQAAIIGVLQKTASDLGKAIAEEEEQRCAACEELSKNLQATAESMERTIEEFRVSTAATLTQHWRTASTNITELRALLERQGTAFSDELEGERRKRHEAIQELQPHIKANEMTSKTALVRMEHLTAGHFGNPRSKHCVVCLEDRGSTSPAKLTPRPPPESRTASLPRAMPEPRARQLEPMLLFRKPA
mmetsp:Transcript_50293/g.150210  ORF Transcript_50293/g.150210 Transcript_50293/m.150210 type:complete len:379 (-) Transcript_50293:28-1164(-)